MIGTDCRLCAHGPPYGNVSPTFMNGDQSPLQAEQLSRLCPDTHLNELQECRKKHSRSLLGHLWGEIPKMLFMESERVAQAASICVGALGAAIYHSQGATIQQRGKSEGKRPQRGGRESAAGPGASHRSGGPAVSTQLHSTVLLEWAEGILKGQPCRHARYKVTDSQHPLVLRAIQQFMHCCPAELQPSAALQVTKTIQSLLDSPSTDASHLHAYLEVLLDAIQLMRADETGALLPDIIDVFLGWSVDPSSTQPCRCGYSQSNVLKQCNAPL